MAPKKAAKKPAAAEPVEPAHDPSWERAVVSGVWDRPISALPDANMWPSWGALRERVLSGCREVRVTDAPSVRDAFGDELIRLSPPLLRAVDFAGCHNLRRLVLSPATACPSLESLRLRGCPSLESVLLQSASLRTADLSGCGSLAKLLAQCPKLESLAVSGCPQLHTLIVWSELLAALELAGSKKLAKLELDCPALGAAAAAALPWPAAPSAALRPAHPPICALLRENAREAAEEHARAVRPAARR